MRARLPDESGYVVNSGVRIHYEVHGTGQPTLLLLPTWAIVDSRHWKMQVPFLARHYRVITFDPRGNGQSDRPRDPAAYADTAFASDTGLYSMRRARSARCWPDSAPASSGPCCSQRPSRNG